MMFAEIRLTTHLNDDLKKPVFKEEAAFVSKNQALTSEGESKVRLFSSSPRLPEINMTEAQSFAILIEDTGTH